MRHEATVQALAAQPLTALARAHFMPQPPQLLTSVAVPTSQPLATIMSQLAKPMVQAAMPQAPLVQLLVALASPQALPQPPQLVMSFCELTSQPLGVIPSQLRNPALHGPMAQAPMVHTGVALASAP